MRTNNHYQKRAYQCIKCMVALFANCKAANRMLNTNEELKVILVFRFSLRLKMFSISFFFSINLFSYVFFFIINRGNGRLLFIGSTMSWIVGLNLPLLSSTTIIGRIKHRVMRRATVIFSSALQARGPLWKRLTNCVLMM